MQKIEDKETKLYKAFQNGVREGKLQFVNSKEFADILEKERFEGIEFGKLEQKKDELDVLQNSYIARHDECLLKRIKQLQKEISSEEGKGEWITICYLELF